MSRLSANEIRERYSAPEASTESGTPKSQVSSEFRKPYQGNVTLASSRSIKYLESLVAERQPEYVGTEYVENLIAGGQRRVSQAIDNLKEMPVVNQISKPQVISQFKARPNRYAQDCELCEFRVEAEEGILTKADDGSWVVAHNEGECPASEFPFPLGRYAVPGEDGALKFYVANRDGLFVQASDELHRVHSKAQNAIIEKIAADPEEASKIYGRELGVCGVCGRTLTDEVSRAAGIGPVCAARGWVM